MAMDTIPLSLDGYTELPPGKIACVTTFLERMTAPAVKPDYPSGLVLRHVSAPSVSWYRDVYRRIGEEWLWFSRSIMPEKELAAVISDPMTVILALEREGEAIGFAELDRAENGQTYIDSFGVVPEARGTGAAHMLMAEVLAEAFGSGATRVHLQTCTFDHQAAVPFYLRNGFTPYKAAIRVKDDPRLNGNLPEYVAQHIPLINATSKTATDISRQ